jgi:hypothetical protein
MEESNSIERDYHAFFDITIVNEDIGRCFASLVESIDSLKAEPQWVPISWRITFNLNELFRFIYFLLFFYLILIN